MYVLIILTLGKHIHFEVSSSWSLLDNVLYLHDLIRSEGKVIIIYMILHELDLGANN